MKISVGSIRKLIELRDGQCVPGCALKGDWVEDMLDLRILRCLPNGSRKRYVVHDRQAFDAYLLQQDSRLADLEGLLAVLTEKKSDRAQMAAVGGNSKTRLVNASTGFHAKCFFPIACTIAGQRYMLDTPTGLSYFVEDDSGFRIPEDTLVVGFENFLCYQRLGDYKEWFNQWKRADEQGVLFVMGFPGRKALVNWLETVPNRFLYFGDFDLAGVQIFESVYRKTLGERAEFLIPTDVEERIRLGSDERYLTQIEGTRNLRSEVPEVQKLIGWIHQYGKGYDQEGYILRH